jgi:hypothetical protein
VVQERDALAAERASATPAHAGETAGASDASDTVERLAAATEQIRVLELQLFERDRGPRDRDVDLEPLLPPVPPTSIAQAGQKAKRYGFKPLRKVQIDRDPALLVDLSVTGAQVIFAAPPEVGRIVTVALLSDETPCFCQGRLIWARREQTAKGRPFRYPTGIAFTAIDDAAIQAYITRHAVSQE